MSFPQNLALGNPNDTIAYLQQLAGGVLANSEGASGSVFGGLTQALEPNRLARTNAEWTGVAVTIATNKLVAAEGETTVVPIPVTPGDVFQHCLVPIGTTAGKAVEEGYTALLEGKASGALLAQSKSKAFSEALKAEEGYSFELESPVEVTAANCPGGFIYFQVNLATVTTIPTCVSVVGPTAGAAKALANSGTGKPAAQYAAKTGTGKKATAESTLGTLTNLAYIPIVCLY